MTDQTAKSLTVDEIKKAMIENLFSSFSTNEKGLSSHEAAVRLKEYGHNEIEEKKVNPIKKFLGYFWGPIPFM